MKNITVSVPDEVYHAARVRAAQLHTTVSAVVKEHLTALAGEPPGQDEARRRMSGLLDKIHKERGNSGFDMSENLTRDQLHDRDALH